MPQILLTMNPMQLVLALDGTDLQAQDYNQGDIDIYPSIAFDADIVQVLLSKRIDGWMVHLLGDEDDDVTLHVLECVDRLKLKPHDYINNCWVANYHGKLPSADYRVQALIITKDRKRIQFDGNSDDLSSIIENGDYKQVYVVGPMSGKFSNNYETMMPFNKFGVFGWSMKNPNMKQKRS